MKLKQLVTGGALAATVLTLGSAQAEKNPNEGVVFCKATIMRSDNFYEQSDVSVTLPLTEGRDYTYWNLGNVPAGGVADSWHSEGGPGRFVAENTGRVGAYIYLTSRASQDSAGYWERSGDCVQRTIQGAYDSRIRDEISNGNQQYELFPSSSLLRWNRQRLNPTSQMYCLAFTRDEKAKSPTWHMLNRSYMPEGRWLEADGPEAEHVARMERGNGYIGAYMGYLPARDFMSFDVKFWAPWNTMTDSNGNQMPQYGAFFTFMVEAASFPLWEHDIEVK